MNPGPENTVATANRGRPKGGGKQSVQRLLDAAEQLLNEVNPAQVTERKIAAVAGVSERMIHYCFGDKDSLLFEVIARRCDEIIAGLDAIDTRTLPPEEVTRHVVRRLIEAYYAKPWIAKIALSEMATTGSAIKDRFIRRYGKQGFGTARLQRIFAELIQRGVYVERVSILQAAQSTIFMISAPLTIASLPGSPGIELEDFKSESWIAHVADVIDCQLSKLPRTEKP